MYHYRTKKGLIFKLLLCIPLFASAAINNFPEINQRNIKGAENRCGTVALGSWLLWFTDNGYPMLSSPERAVQNNPFSVAQLEPKQRTVLSQLDENMKGTREVKLYRLIEALIQYFHAQQTDALKLNIYYYNLPEKTLLKQLTKTDHAIILFHGIYSVDTAKGQLTRSYGHYSCLVGSNDTGLIANTYARNYSFSLKPIPMDDVSPEFRYRPTSLKSYVYLNCPEEEFPRYQFQTISPSDKQHALLQTNEAGNIFAYSNETILLEGVIVFGFEVID